METRINVAELLRNCPTGMELDCAMFEKLYFDYIDDSLNNPYPILCYGKTNEARNVVRFSKYGTYTLNSNAKCVIFPKGETSWDGFVPPVEFKEGDIVTRTDRGSLVAFIYKERTSVAIVKHHFALYTGSLGTVINGEIWVVESNIRFATSEEKTKLFQAIKDNGYKWNAEKKCLEKELQYPKTYKECCDILGLHTMDNDAQGYNSILIIRLQELIICRDAYWKFYSEQMRLGYPWQPDYRMGSIKFCIRNIGCKFEMTETIQYNTILAFPTAEMRNAFYENFKEDIEKINELL